MSRNLICFEFRVVTSGISLDDRADVDAILGAFDGEASLEATTTRLVEIVLTLDGEDPIGTVEAALSRIESALPKVAVHWIDQELVGISDIAQLIGQSRESVRLYADGKRGGGAFPAPVGVVGDSVRVWRWADVDAWLRQHAGYDFPTHPLPAWAIDVTNASLHTRQRRAKRVGARKSRKKSQASAVAATGSRKRSDRESVRRAG